MKNVRALFFEGCHTFKHIPISQRAESFSKYVCFKVKRAKRWKDE